ncbi:MAG: alpha/beta fold hydrolase [Proteobacteria bacterium]|nr:alpha/beta fold hydrolase [Pseudomonadota bacterium]
MLHHKRRGKGPPLVLVHGFLGGSEEWDDLFNILAPQFDVIAIDLPGFGGSARIAAPATLSGYAELVAEKVNALGVGRFVLLGHSMGAMIAQQFALESGARLERLVLYGAASAGSLPGRFESYDDTIARLLRVGIAEGGKPIIASWFVAGENHPAYALYCRMAEAANTQTAVSALRAVASWRVTERLGEIAMPVLVIGGDRDRSTEPAEQFRLWRGLPRGQLCILPNCAHATHLEEPEIFWQLLRRFLAPP